MCNQVERKMSSIFDKMRKAISRKGSKSSSGSQPNYARAASTDGGASSSSGGGGGGGSYQMYQVRLDEPQLGVQVEPTPGDGRPRIIGVSPVIAIVHTVVYTMGHVSINTVHDQVVNDLS